jgi:predicted nuclease with RNAse H fold
MISIGIDLAGLEKNKTGFCILEDNVAETFILHTDDEIVENVKKVKPDVVGIDAPLIYPPKIRKCDRTLKKYGAMPPTMKSMSILSKRGFFLAKKLKGFNVIEVFPTGSAKILEIYSKDVDVMIQGLLSFGLIIKRRILTKDEADSIIAAFTALLYLQGSTEKIGDKEDFVVVPKSTILILPKTEKHLS